MSIYKASNLPRGYQHLEPKYFRFYNQPNIVFLGTTWGSGTDLTPPSWGTLFAPDIGTAQNQRIGRQVRLHRIQLRGTLNYPPIINIANPPHNNCIRLILVWDKSNAGVNINPQQVMSSSAGYTFNEFQSGFYVDKYELLQDEIIVLPFTKGLINNTITMDVPGCNCQVNWDICFKEPILIDFKANLISSSALNGNGFFLLGGMLDATPFEAQYAPNFLYYANFTFTDEN